MQDEKNLIFNHFHENSNGELQLIAECRSKDDEPTPGFTCGNDPTLRTGTEVFIPKRIVQRRRDERKTTILQPEKHLMLQALLGKHSNCPLTGGQCDPIKLFNESTCEGIELNDLVHFPNAFNYGENCMPVDQDNHDTNGWIETKTVYVVTMIWSTNHLLEPFSEQWEKHMKSLAQLTRLQLFQILWKLKQIEQTRMTLKVKLEPHLR